VQSLTKCILVLMLATYGGNASAQKHGQALVDSLEAELPKQKGDTTNVKLLNAIAYNYFYISPLEGRKYGTKSLELATKLNWKPGIARAYMNLGNSYEGTADFQNALACYEKAYKIYDSAGNKSGIAFVCTQMGNVCKNMSEYPKALKYFLVALKIHESAKDDERAAFVNGRIGSVYKDQEDFTTALEYYGKAINVFRKTGDKINIAKIYISMGIVYQGQKNYPKALDYFRKAIELDKETENANGVATGLGNIGDVYTMQKDYAAAIQYFRESMAIYEKMDDNLGVAYNDGNIAECLLNFYKYPKSIYGDGNSKKDPAIPTGRAALVKAFDYLNEEIAIGKTLKIPDLLQQGYQNISEAYRLSGDYKKALEYADAYRTIKDSVFSQENEKKIVKQTMKYEFDKKEAVAKVEQEKKDAIAAKELQRQKLVRNGFMGGFAVVLLFAGIFFSQRNKIKEGKKQSDELLLNILPAEVAEELKAKGSSEAKMIDEVTVLFTDFKGFTQLSEKLTPTALVAEINQCFSAFDLIMQKYGVEKIKTIGDSYMAAGGLPTPNKTHPEDVVKAALDIQEYMLRHRLTKEARGELFFEIRIGINTGPVVAGIVGIKKFQYDIWGDTVNTASRMESSGEPGKVNISGTTYELVKDKFTCAYRGEIDAKGKGKLSMYFVSPIKGTGQNQGNNK
jgi:adenylate cyclase